MTEDKQFSRDYLDPDKRSIANAVQVFFRNGTSTERIEVHFPLGHRQQREKDISVLPQQADAAFASHYGDTKATQLASLFTERRILEAMPVRDLAFQLGERS